MRIDAPRPAHVPGLRDLWKEAFGDGDQFLDDFFTLAFSPHRSRCVFEAEQPIAALYWFDELCRGKPMAYLYAVATRKDRRNRGLCRVLIADTHRLLAANGYAGVLLKPATPELSKAYAAMGYRAGIRASEIVCDAGSVPVPIERISGEGYLRLRSRMLPQGGVLLPERNSPFLESQAALYRGADFLLAAPVEENTLSCAELLGNTSAAPGILAALGVPHGTFLTPGGEADYAMYCCLDGQTPPPDYFGLTFE